MDDMNDGPVFQELKGELSRGGKPEPGSATASVEAPVSRSGSRMEERVPGLIYPEH